MQRFTVLPMESITTTAARNKNTVPIIMSLVIVLVFIIFHATKLNSINSNQHLLHYL